MYHHFKPKIIKNRTPTPLPHNYQLLKQSHQFQQNIHYYSQTHAKRKSLQNLQLNTKFLSRIIDQQYKLDQFKPQMFSDSLILYTKLIKDPDIGDKDFKRLMLFINDRYKFRDSAQQFGLLIGNLVIMKVDNPSLRNQISQVIERLYIFADKDRSFCNFSKIIHYKLLDVIQEFIKTKYLNVISYLGWQHFERVQTTFQQFYNKYQTYFRQIWKECKFNEDKHQHQVAMLIQRIIVMRNNFNQQNNLQLFAFLFLLKFLLSQHTHTDNKLSQVLIKTLRSVIGKLTYMIINIEFLHMNWFLLLYKLVMKNKDFFAQSRLKLQLGLYVAKIYFHDNRAIYFNNSAQQFCEITSTQHIFMEYEKQLNYQFPHIASLTLLSQNPSQLLSFGTPFNQRRKASYESISKYLSQKNNKNQRNSYLPLHRINQTIMTHKSQILKYTQEKLQKQQYLELLVSLEQIYLMFEQKVNELTDAVTDDMRHQKLKDLQTWYVASYMKILIQLKSQSNNLYKQGHMPIDFISQFYNEIISRFTQLTMTDVNFQSLYTFLFMQYSITDTIVFDIQSQRFGLRELFDLLAQKQALMGSTISMYEIQMLKKHYNLACNGSIMTNNTTKNDKKTQLQKLIEKILQRKYLLAKKTKEITQSAKKKQSSSQNFYQRRNQQLQKQQLKRQNKSQQSQSQKQIQKSINKNNQNLNNNLGNKRTKGTQNSVVNSLVPNIFGPGDQYSQQFIITSTKKFPQPSATTFSFIKTEILRLVQNYLNYYPMSVFSDRKAFYEIFCCLVLAIDNEALLMDIYANILFKLLSDKKEQLVISTYESFAMVRKLHSEKFQYTFKQTPLARREITCMFQKLRKIQIKRNRQKNKNFSGSMMTNPLNGKQKLSRDLSYNQQQHSKVYLQYFRQLFCMQYKDILTYGRQLFNLKKYKQSIYVLEIVREKMDFKLNQIQQAVVYRNDKNSEYDVNDRKQIEKLMTQYDLLLSNCYATLNKQFKSTQSYINRNYLYNKVKDNNLKKIIIKSTRNKSINSKIQQNVFHNKQNQQKQHHKIYNRLQKSSLIPNLTQLITNQYLYHTNVTSSYLKYSPSQQIDTKKMIYQEETFRSNCYSTIFYYTFQKINGICTMDDLQLFYTNILLGGIIYAWYQEKYLKLMTKIMNIEAIEKEQFPDEEILADGDFSQHSQFSNQAQQKLPVYSQLIQSYCHTQKSKIDKFSLINMVNIIECTNKQYNFQTLRMLNQSLLQTKRHQIVYAKINKIYGGIDKFEDISLLDLQMLQKFHFQKENYQHVKAITKNMRLQLLHKTYGQKESYYPNWPEVYGYELISKIYDLNCIQNPDKYWRDIDKIISQQKYVVVQGKKFSLENMRKIPILAKNIEEAQPKLFAKLVIELQTKIKQLFKFLRIIFSKLSLSKTQGSLLIFEIMQKIFHTILITGITREQINIDFFLYYLRFLCEKVDTKYFLIRQARYDKMKKRIQESGQAQQQQYVYTKRNLIKFLIQNQQYVKHHTLYMIRSLDPEVNTQKNLILRNILVQIFVNNPVENLWTLTYLKYYQTKMPVGKKSTQKSYDKKEKIFDKKKQKEAQMNSKYIYPNDSEINQIHNAAIQQLYRVVTQFIDPIQYSQLTSIPYQFILWLEKTASQKVDDPSKPGEMLYFAKPENIQKQREEINKKIRMSKFRIPYPFDHRMYIKSVQNVKLSIHDGKSMPCFVSFCCGLYSDIKEENKYYKKNKGLGFSQSQVNQQNQAIILKHILLKNNFTNSDHRIETNTANFYKQIGLLDDQTTYGIINLTKYILIIQKICVPHKSLKQLYAHSYDINYQNHGELKHKFYSQIRKQYSNTAHLIEPKWFDKNKEIKESNKKGFMFYHFYNKTIEDYKNINQWWVYMQNYVRTLAYWSYVCFVTKLGDRHLTNILISNKGKFIHIDYQYNFGYGLMLPYPEWMPFRLTDLMVEPLGTFKEKGLFLGYFVEIAKKFNINEDNIWKALCHFSSTQRQLIQDTSQFKTISLQNSIEEKCEKIIDLSMDTSLLRLMFAGWNSDL